jgi:hypothetical protein
MTKHNLMTPFYGRKRFLRQQRPICFRTLARRYQLVELFGIMGAIVLIWLGAQLDNHLATGSIPEAIEPTNGDLIVGVPVGAHRHGRDSGMPQG